MIWRSVGSSAATEWRRLEAKEEVEFGAGVIRRGSPVPPRAAWSFCWCLSTKSLRAKHLPQKIQRYGFSRVCECWCLFKCSCLTKPLVHVGHKNGLGLSVLIIRDFLGMGRIPWPAGLAKLDWLPFTNILGSGTNKKSLSALSILVSPMSFSFFALKFLFGARVFEKNVCWERQCLTKKKNSMEIQEVLVSLFSFLIYAGSSGKKKDRRKSAQQHGTKLSRFIRAAAVRMHNAGAPRPNANGSIRNRPFPKGYFS